VGAGSAAKGLRADWQRQLGMAVQQCGFERARIHGWHMLDLADEKETDALCDFLTDLGIAPIVRLDDRGKSENLESFSRHIIARYGARRAHKWRFEIPMNKSFEPRATHLKNTDRSLSVGVVTSASKLGRPPPAADSVVVAGVADDDELKRVRDTLDALEVEKTVHWDGVSSVHAPENGLSDAIALTRRYLSGGLPVDSLSLVSFSGMCGAGAYLVDDWGVRQPSGHACRMMDTLGAEELDRGRGYIITRDGQGCARALAWTDADGGDEIELAGMPPCARFMIETLDAAHGWAYPVWRQMGCPKSLSRYQAQALRQAALRTGVEWVRADGDGRLRLRGPVDEDRIVLVKEVGCM